MTPIRFKLAEWDRNGDGVDMEGEQGAGRGGAGYQHRATDGCRLPVLMWQSRTGGVAVRCDTQSEASGAGRLHLARLLNGK